MFTLTLVDLEYETSISIWEFEMMIVLKKWSDVTNVLFSFSKCEKRKKLKHKTQVHNRHFVNC